MSSFAARDTPGPGQVGHTAESASRLVTHLTAIFDNTQDAIWSVDLDQRFVTFNAFLTRRIREWYGITPYAGMRHGGNTGSESTFWREAYRRAFQGERVLTQFEYQRPEGVSYVEFLVSPIQNADGSITGAAGIGRDVTHLRKLDEEIRQREAAWRQVLDTTGDVIWSVDRNGRFLTFNRFLQRIIHQMTGVELELGMHHTELGIPEEDAFWKSVYERALRGEAFAAEREYRGGPSGTAIVEYSITPIREGEEIIGVAGVGRNVRHLREIARALERSMVAYRMLFDDSPMPMFTVDLETLHFTQANQATLKLYGYSLEEFQALTLLDLRPESAREAFAEQKIPVIRRDTSDRHHFSRHVRKDGSLIDVEIFSHSFNLEGRPSRLTLVKEITEQRQAEANLILANERFRLASEAVTSIIWDWDAATNRFECFGPLERVIGFDAAEAGRKPLQFWIERIHHDDRWRVGRSFIRALRRGTHFESECRIRRRDGQYIYVWNSGAIVRAAMGKPTRIVGSTLDITERKHMELAIERERENAIIAKERAEEMTRLKSSFLANMSHEIRTPLTAILGFAELLTENLDDPEKKQQAAMIQSSGQRLLTTINQILDLARIEAGKLELHPQDCAVVPIVEECVALLQPLAQKKGIRLTVRTSSEVASSDLVATLDKLHLNQILTNLIGNAIKFTEAGSVSVLIRELRSPEPIPPGGRIVQTGTAVYPCVAVEVRDTGIGIAQEFLPHVFDEFKQASAGYDRSFEGTGIGLTITAKLVEMMRGAISVSSQAGQSSCFTVQFPVR